MFNAFKFLILVAAALFVAVIFTLIFTFMGSWRCSAQYPDLETKFEPVIGCLVKTKEHGFVPASNFRVVN